jgi:hypothetical protein
MKRTSILFLRAVIVLIGMVALFILIRFPLTEGRAVNLDLMRIYLDPFILYGYVSSIAFFVALYKAFKLLGYIGEDKLFTLNSIRVLRSIKYCAILLSVLILIAGLFIVIFHNPEDDAAGFLSLCIITIFISITVAIALAVLERLLRNAVDLKSENDLTI